MQPVPGNTPTKVSAEGARLSYRWRKCSEVRTIEKKSPKKVGSLVSKPTAHPGKIGSKQRDSRKNGGERNT